MGKVKNKHSYPLVGVLTNRNSNPVHTVTIPLLIVYFTNPTLSPMPWLVSSPTSVLTNRNNLDSSPTNRKNNPFHTVTIPFLMAYITSPTRVFNCSFSKSASR